MKMLIEKAAIVFPFLPQWSRKKFVLFVSKATANSGRERKRINSRGQQK